MNNTDTSLLTSISESFLALSGWEVIATLLGIAYILLASRESLWCWPAAFSSTLIYTVLFWEGQLPMQALLNVYYMGMAIYGWWLWRSHQSQKEDLQVSKRSWRFHVMYISAGLMVSILAAFTLEQFVTSNMPYLDAAVMVFSVMTTVLMAHKVLENWLYWLVINSAAIVLYWHSGFYVTIVMFMIYFVLAILGYQRWKQSYLNHQAS